MPERRNGNFYWNESIIRAFQSKTRGNVESSKSGRNGRTRTNTDIDGQIQKFEGSDLRIRVGSGAAPPYGRMAKMRKYERWGKYIRGIASATTAFF
jgi:hypothetical protein